MKLAQVTDSQSTYLGQTAKGESLLWIDLDRLV